MSFSITALQLVNRVNRRRRVKDVGAISGIESLATLDMVNRAMNRVLSMKEWEFDKRTTQITTRPKLTGVSLSGSTGTSIGISKTGLVNADMVGDYITRASFKGSTDFPNTAMRLNTATNVSLGISVGRAPSSLGASFVTTTGELFYAEYLLPETVRNVLRVTHQENELTLEQVGASVEFDELFPRPNIRVGEPEIISVGGYDISTYLNTDEAPSPKLRMIVFPVPDDEYVLDYTYMYRHAEMTTDTDTLDGVPPEVVDQIVDDATIFMKRDWDRLTDEANSMMADNRRSIEEVHNRHRGMSADRARVGNWDGSAIRFRDRYSIARGRLIGGD